MKQVNLAEAKAKLSALVDEASKGETIVIAKAGRPVAHLVPAPRKPDVMGLLGSLAGEIWVAPDFDETSPDLIAAFEGHGPLIEADDALRRKLEKESKE
jgi:prevent-host-death family protein